MPYRAPADDIRFILREVVPIEPVAPRTEMRRAPATQAALGVWRIGTSCMLINGTPLTNHAAGRAQARKRQSSMRSGLPTWRRPQARPYDP